MRSTHKKRENACRAMVHVLAATALLFSLAAYGASSDPVVETVQKVQKLIQARDFSGARAELSHGLKEYPNDGPLYGLLGVVEANEGNYAAAEADFKKAIALIPRYAGAYLDLGRLYQENVAKDPEAVKKALDTYERLLRFQPNNREALFQSAFLLGHEGSFQASLDRLARLPAADQDAPQALAVRCAALAAIGKSKEAEPIADRLLQKPETSEADVLQMLPVLEAHGASPLAERVLRAQTERQGSYESFYALGLLEKRRSNLAGARATLEQAARYRPHDVPLLIDLARIAHDQHDRKGALGYLAHARDLQPQNGGIHFFWGIVCIEEGLAEEAYQSLQRAVALTPDNPQYDYALGAVILQRNDHREAIPLFQKYRQLKPDDPHGMLALGAAYLENLDYDKARPELDGAARHSETAPGAHYYLARLANHAGDFAGALKEFELAIQANPNMPESYAEMGALFIKLRDYTQAEKALRKALELYPESYAANLNLMVLYQRTKDPRANEQAQRFQGLREKLDKSKMEMFRTIQVQP
jgi:tetratricopeptide (TPR) repeat protein